MKFMDLLVKLLAGSKGAQTVAGPIPATVGAKAGAALGGFKGIGKTAMTAATVLPLLGMAKNMMAPDMSGVSPQAMQDPRIQQLAAQANGNGLLDPKMALTLGATTLPMFARKAGGNIAKHGLGGFIGKGLKGAAGVAGGTMAAGLLAQSVAGMQLNRALEAKRVESNAQNPYARY